MRESFDWSEPFGFSITYVRTRPHLTPNGEVRQAFRLLTRQHAMKRVMHRTPPVECVRARRRMAGRVLSDDSLRLFRTFTGRHESGSYYTPRPIVSFMCREALKHYLDPVAGDEAAVARFVDDADPSGLTAPEAVLAALRRVRVCDPACGSGAYLLGMMQELLRLREALFAVHAKDHKSIYDRKLEMIQNNLYGVDSDEFAVNIAKLRLWLSLAVDYTGAKPEPLPNLDFKIERGDSLTAPNPQKLDDLIRFSFVSQVDELAELKAKFITAHGDDKRKLKAKIAKLQEKLESQMPDQSPDGAIDWRVSFAEVFKEGGFDVVLANPPY